MAVIWESLEGSEISEVGTLFFVGDFSSLGSAEASEASLGSHVGYRRRLTVVSDNQVPWG